MTTWGVVRLPSGMDAAAGAGEGAVAAGVAAHLDGLVAVAGSTPWKDVLATLPGEVARIVELDATMATDPEAGGIVRSLLAVDAGGHAAVVSARPLADALKRVDDDVVVDGLERDGLLIPGAPCIIDRARLAAALSAPPADPHAPDDAVAMLLAAGHDVLVVGPDGPVTTVRAEVGG